ncbi:MAG: forespore capture DNA-binding protein RefZ [Bacillus sp. (in: firmicutes)]
MKKVLSRNSTKQKIVEAALRLFHANGYDGTSIRDIALQAEINPANISYYFRNKNGLLEYCFTSYLEQYIDIIEKEVGKLDPLHADSCLLSIVTKLLDFQNEQFLAARFINRELSLDTRLNREILSTYLAKEKNYFQFVLETGIKSNVFLRVNIPTFILQLKGLLTAPITHGHYAAELLNIHPFDQYYMEHYKQQCFLLLMQTLLVPHTVVSR